ncbi:unnamed protein product [Phytophthora fragariaefolia]|uniref:Unnamed protein product n=1 Tax=Phytophthora fragariaefolia TaxID=1490495 RepID=A0A9W6WYR2_9STRA|nr:unnamed protein product [Phytophthora fragariaefolia]
MEELTPSCPPLAVTLQHSTPHHFKVIHPMVSGWIALLTSVAQLGSSAHGYGYYVQRLPNGGNVKSYSAIGHTDGRGHHDTLNEFGNAFDEAGSEWTVSLCEADTDGDGQTNGEELGDPCCVWADGDPSRTTGVSHPSIATSKSDPSLWANINCTTDTAASSAAIDTTPTPTPTSTVSTATPTPTTTTSTGTGTTPPQRLPAKCIHSSLHSPCPPPSLSILRSHPPPSS